MTHKKAFLKGYAQEVAITAPSLHRHCVVPSLYHHHAIPAQMGEPDADLDALLLDVELTKFTHWHSGGKLHVWGLESSSTASMLNKIEACRCVRALRIIHI